MDFVIEISNLTLFLRNHIGRSVDDLLKEIGIETNAKSKNFILSTALCSQYKGKDFFDALCKHENIHLKTIQLNKKGKPKEAMSFSAFDFEKIVKEDWATSGFKNYITERFLFFVYKKNDFDNYLEDVFLWRINDEDLESVNDTWCKTKDILLSGNVIKNIDTDGDIITNFPTEAATAVCHVRPHGRNGTDLSPLPIQDVKTGYRYLSKHSFWFNHNFIYKIISERRK